MVVAVVAHRTQPPKYAYVYFVQKYIFWDSRVIYIIIEESEGRNHIL